MNQTRKKIFFVLYGVFWLLISLCLIEAYARLSVYWEYGGPVFQKHPKLLYVLRPNLHVKHFEMGQINTSPTGYRIGKKAPKGRGILFVGDSVTFGLKVDYEDTFVGQLQQGHPHLSFYNGGVPGYAIEQSSAWYREVGQELELQAVVLMINPNDLLPPFYLGARDQLQFVADRSWPRSHLAAYQMLLPKLYQKGWAKESRVQYGDLLQTIYLGDPRTNPVLKNRISVFQSSIQDLRAMTKEKGIDLYIVLLPRFRDAVLGRAYQSASLYERWCNDARVFNAIPFFQEPAIEIREQFYLDPGHFSLRGHQHMARFLAEHVLKKYLDL